jgi:hypothetical protein
VKYKARLNDKTFNSYFKEITTLLHYKDQMFSKEIIAVYSENLCENRKYILWAKRRVIEC